MPKSFLQSKDWEQFQKALGRNTFRIDGILAIEFPLPLGLSYLYVPRANPKKKFFTEIEKIAQKENSIFLKIDPESPLDLSPKTYHLRPSLPIQPKQTLLLDLRPSEEQILAEMKPKWRYNIRLAQRHKVKVIKTTKKEDIEHFWKMAVETAKRDRFRYHPKLYYQKLLEVLGSKNFAKLYLTKLENEVITADIFIFTKETAIYLHGASLDKYRNVMAPHLLQWEAIREAKKKRLKWFDFWGIDEKRWPGVTNFKMGFAPEGKVVSYPDSQIMVFRPFWYLLYKIGKLFR